jgi:uncharacterized protein Yka (UPF0111/DUF47 family)
MLNELSKVTTEVAKLITECVSNYNYNTAVEYFKKIKELERHGDKTLTQIFEALNSTFITPFDREDIHSLANMMDDIADFMNNCAKRIVLYHPTKSPPSAVQLGQLLIEATENLSKAINKLATLKEDANDIKE